MATITYREALNQALSEEIERDDQVVLMGEEVAQFKGSYKVSEGLLEKFGSDRIIDTPISEAAFSGLAVGAAMMGMRPVVEFMFWSFCYVAFDQIFNNAANVRYMSGGLITPFFVVLQTAEPRRRHPLPHAGKLRGQYSRCQSHLSRHAGRCKRHAQIGHSRQ